MPLVQKICGVNEFKEGNFWMSLVAEFLGTGFLVFVACGSAQDSTNVEIAFCFGLMVAIMVQTVGGISGGHINPAVTAGMMVTGNCSILRGILYVIAQCLGAIVGALILAGVVTQHPLGLTKVSSNISPLQGMGIEIMITFVLVFTVFAVVDPKRTDNAAAPLMIGLSVTACHLFAIKYTGSSMNTARTFGPAVVANYWDAHWVYWVGPILGGIIAGLLYKLMYAAPKQTEDNVETMEMVTE